MSRKHFEMLAEYIRNSADLYLSKVAHMRAAQELAHELAWTNPNFDRARFMAACMPRVYVGTRHANTWERAL